MKSGSRILLACVCVFCSLGAYSKDNDSNNGDWKTRMGTDGRVVAFPADWKTSMGTDGRVIALPSDWKTSMGTDGRVIALPSDWKTSMGTDGRVIAIPTFDKTNTVQTTISYLTLYYLVNSSDRKEDSDHGSR